MIEQQKVGEIAADLNVPLEQVKYWRKDAMRKIRKNARRMVKDGACHRP